MTFLPLLNQAGNKNKSKRLTDAITPVSASGFKTDPSILKELICALKCSFCKDITSESNNTNSELGKKRNVCNFIAVLQSL